MKRLAATAIAALAILAAVPQTLAKAETLSPFDPLANAALASTAETASSAFCLGVSRKCRENKNLSQESRQSIDSMHARYYSHDTGRFLSVDPVGGDIGASQSWNRYAYVRGNPIGLIDPNGRQAAGAIAAGMQNELITRNEDNLATMDPTVSKAISATHKVEAIAVSGAMMAVPGPEDLVFAAVAATRVGRFAGRILGDATSFVAKKIASTRAGRAAGNLQKGLRLDVVLSGGRGGGRVKNLTGPADSVVKGSGERVFVTNSKGEVVLDITRDRVKPVTPGKGFGEKRDPTREELLLLDRIADVEKLE